MALYPSYLIDSNAFIESKNRYYAFDICPGFWEFMIEDFNAGRSLSIHHVYEELLVGGDELTDWMKKHLAKSSFKDCLGDAEVEKAYLQVATYVQGAYKENVAADFLADTVADPWLVAYAVAHDGCIVTQETSKKSKKKASLVDVCDHFRVHHVNVIEFLRSEEVRFVYSKNGGQS